MIALNFEKRVSVLYGVMVLVICVLLARLYNLSKPETNESMSVLDGQYTARIDVCERSGFVYDRNMKLLSHEKSGYIALVNPAVCKSPVEYAEIIEHGTVVSSFSDIYEKINNGIPFTVLLKDEIQTDIQNLDGVYVYEVYEENENIAKHLLGYNNSDGEGVSGLRKHYSDDLNTKMSQKISAVFEINAKQKSLSPFEIMHEGGDGKEGIVTTIDKPLQMFCDDLESEISSGAIAVSDVQNGEILALASFPGYDSDNIGAVLDSDKGELLNRAIMSFTPGSVFKIIVAAAAIETNYNLWELEYECVGFTEVDGDVFRCHNRSGHGKQTMAEAFANSCNTYFINLGQRTGLDSIIKIAKRLELDKPAEANFLHEIQNYFPDSNNRSLGYLANISFGQGDLCLSPLDMLKVVSAVSTGYITPMSVIRKDDKNMKNDNSDKTQKTRVFRRETCEKMLMMMEKCIEEGTGNRAKTEGLSLGGKTATAQTGRFDEEGVEYVHKWFCGVYPVDNPKYSICILCDYSCKNDVTPAVIFSQICTWLAENGF